MGGDVSVDRRTPYDEAFVRGGGGGVGVEIFGVSFLLIETSVRNGGGGKGRCFARPRKRFSPQCFNFGRRGTQDFQSCALPTELPVQRKQRTRPLRERASAGRISGGRMTDSARLFKPRRGRKMIRKKRLRSFRKNDTHFLDPTAE